MFQVYEHSSKLRDIYPISPFFPDPTYRVRWWRIPTAREEPRWVLLAEIMGEFSWCDPLARLVMMSLVISPAIMLGAILADLAIIGRDQQGYHEFTFHRDEGMGGFFFHVDYRREIERHVVETLIFQHLD